MLVVLTANGDSSADKQTGTTMESPFDSLENGNSPNIRSRLGMEGVKDA